MRQMQVFIMLKSLKLHVISRWTTIRTYNQAFDKCALECIIGFRRYVQANEGLTRPHTPEGLDVLCPGRQSTVYADTAFGVKKR